MRQRPDELLRHGVCSPHHNLPMVETTVPYFVDAALQLSLGHAPAASGTFEKEVMS